MFDVIFFVFDVHLVWFVRYTVNITNDVNMIPIIGHQIKFTKIQANATEMLAIKAEKNTHWRQQILGIILFYIFLLVGSHYGGIHNTIQGEERKNESQH